MKILNLNFITAKNYLPQRERVEDEMNNQIINNND